MLVSHVSDSYLVSQSCYSVIFSVSVIFSESVMLVSHVSHN